jgi:hypothetical protein
VTERLLLWLGVLYGILAYVAMALMLSVTLAHAQADLVTMNVEVNGRQTAVVVPADLCDWVAAKAKDDEGNVPSCSDYLLKVTEDVMTQAVKSWQAQRDEEIIRNAMSDPVKRQRVIQAAQ